MKAVSLSLSRLEGDLQMAARAKGTIQQYLASIRRFEEFLGTEVGEANQEAIRHWVDHLQTQPIGPERLRCHYSARTWTNLCPSSESPPAVTSTWMCGWKCRSRVQVWSTIVRPSVALSRVRPSSRSNSLTELNSAV